MKRLAEIPWDREAVFLRRPNRFLALCRDPAGGKDLEVHVRDPGRLTELLYPGNRVLLARAGNRARKTGWDLIAARSSSNGWVLVNSGFHSDIAESILSDSGLSPLGSARRLQREVRIGRSRLDFLVHLDGGDHVYVEIKGCTLLREGRALFPDAPTERGRRHLLELAGLRRLGSRAAVIFLVFCPQAACFQANGETDPLFRDTFHEVIRDGVEVYPICLEYKDGFVWYIREIEVCR